MKKMFSKWKQRFLGWKEKHEETLFWTINVLAAAAWTILVIDMPAFLICLMCRPVIGFVYSTKNWHVNCWPLLIMIFAIWVYVSKKLFAAVLKTGTILLTDASREVLEQIVRSYNKFLKMVAERIKFYEDLWICQLAMPSRIKAPLKILVSELKKGVAL